VPRYFASVAEYCWRCWRRRWTAWLGSAVAIAALLTLSSAAALFLVTGSRNVDQQARSASTVRIFLRDAASAAQVQALKSRVSTLSGVQRVSYLNKNEALAEADNDPRLKRITDAIGGNPFPASLVVDVKDFSSASNVTQVAAADPAADPQVPTSFTAAQAAHLNGFVAASRWTLAVIGMAVLALCALVITALLRGEIRQRKSELRILTLFGTPRLVVRVPMLFEGISIAVLGSATAALITNNLGANALASVNSYLSFLQLQPTATELHAINIATLGASVAASSFASFFTRLPR
jgi:cell division transport system permease protein